MFEISEVPIERISACNGIENLPEHGIHTEPDIYQKRN